MVVKRLWYFNPTNSIISFLQHVSTFIEAKGLTPQRKDLTLIFFLILQSVMKCRSSCDTWNSGNCCWWDKNAFFQSSPCHLPPLFIDWMANHNFVLKLNWMKTWYVCVVFFLSHLYVNLSLSGAKEKGKGLKLHILQLVSVKWNIMNHSGHSLYFCELTPSYF